MQTTLELDDQLMAQAMKSSGETTQRGAIEAGLRLLIHAPTLDDNTVEKQGRPTGFRRLGKTAMTGAEAGAAIRKIAEKHTLDGIEVRELIEEGRR